MIILPSIQIDGRFVNTLLVCLEISYGSVLVVVDPSALANA